jgi:hypothetical protein
MKSAQGAAVSEQVALWSRRHPTPVSRERSRREGNRRPEFGRAMNT